MASPGLVGARCRVAIVGAGYTATEHARAFRDVPGVVLVGVHSRTRATAEEFARQHRIPVVCDSVAELYERTGADLVVVTVVELAMRTVSMAAFEHPWTVLMEKPPGYDLADARRIRDAARERTRRVFVALNRRFLAATTRAAADLSAIDAPRFIKVQDQQNLQQAEEAGEPPEVLANFMFANGIHTIDYLTMFGRGAVSAVVPIMPFDARRPGLVVARIDFESGDTALYEGIWHAPAPWAVSITVPGRRWEMRPLEELHVQTLGGRPQRVEPHAWDQAFKPGFRAQAEHAAAAALGHPSRSVSLDEAFRTMQLISAIYGASRA